MIFGKPVINAKHLSAIIALEGKTLSVKIAKMASHEESVSIFSWKFIFTLIGDLRLSQ
jgi:hypothetical protein